MILRSPRTARGHPGQPPTAPMGGGFTPTRGRGLPFALSIHNRQGSNAPGGQDPVGENPTIGASGARRGPSRRVGLVPPHLPTDPNQNRGVP